MKEVEKEPKLVVEADGRRLYEMDLGDLSRKEIKQGLKQIKKELRKKNIKRD